jgi:hypothetical protein
LAGANTWTGVNTFTQTIVGNISTASALHGTPTTCSTPYVASGIQANGNAICVSATGWALAPYTTPPFTNQTTVTILGTAHRYTTTALITECYDSGTPAHWVAPAQRYVNTSTYDVTILFAVPQSGFCLVNGGTGPPGATGPNAVSTSTTTALTGMLKGNGTNVAVASAGSDYAAANATLTINATSCALGGTCTLPLSAGGSNGQLLANASGLQTGVTVGTGLQITGGALTPVGTTVSWLGLYWPVSSGVFSATQVLYEMTAPIAFSVASGCNLTTPYQSCTCSLTLDTAANASTTFTFYKNGTGFGTAVVAPIGTVATITVGSTTSFAVNDVFAWKAPGTPDTTAAGARLSLCFLR